MKLFSPEKANALIPVLEPMIAELWARRRDLAIVLLSSELEMRAAHAGPATAGRPRRPPDSPRLKDEIIGLIYRIEAHGCVVKDSTSACSISRRLRDGRPVYLCWKSGEPQVAHWHRLDEAFADRKEL